MQRPQNSVLDAFNIRGNLSRSEDGMQGVFFADHYILKYYSDVCEARYICECYHQLAKDDFVVPKPILSSHQRYVEDGWIAYPMIPAEAIQGHHSFRYEIVKSFNKSTRGLPWNQELNVRNDPWSLAHHIALGAKEIDPNYSPRARDMLSRLLDLCHLPLSEFGVYHGDLANNIMLHEDGRPVVLDFSPVLAPHRYAEAIFLVDILAHQEASESQFLDLLEDATYIELLIRATVFRIACSAEFEKRYQTDSFQKEASEWMRALSMIQQFLPNAF